jgi:uncharacterized protein YdhG (YjbR/CyaY superfamily)
MAESTSGTAAVDAYLAGYPAEVKAILEEMRSVILSVMPEAKQKIAYGIPTFTLDGRNVVHIGGFATHVSLFPGGEGVEHFGAELAGYKTSKGTIQFQLNQPIPYPLIRRVVEWCLQKHQLYLSQKAKK